MAEQAQYQGTGKRKTSVARVILRPGDGATGFNGRTIEEYFPRAAHRAQALAPLKVAGVEGTFDLRVRVHGGGPSGQAVQIKPIVDTGYDGFLTLLPSLVASLGLPLLGSQQATLADGSQQTIDYLAVTGDWDGQTRHEQADTVDGHLLLGKLMIQKHNPKVEFVVGGAVEITARP